MPSWRRDLDHKSKEYVKENEFFKKFNSLINNEKLIEKAKEKNYDIIFRPHPKVYEYIDLFDENNFVKIDYEKIKYQTLFNMGSIMITDYSSIGIDYLIGGKPIIYLTQTSDEYSKNRGFILPDNYQIFMPGEKVKSYIELSKAIEDSLTVDSWKAKRLDALPILHKFADSRASERIYDIMKNIE
jgi:CDP-glycerol glycerophosphotransferase (TagB/SpsB family)